MRSKDPSIEMAAISFAAKFGFLTRDLFFEFLCPRRRAQQYLYWKHLKKSGNFIAAKRNSSVYYLTSRSSEIGRNRVKRKYFYHVEHDSVAARLSLLLEREFPGSKSWTETQMRMDPLLAIRLLGSLGIDKLPDLVVDVSSEVGVVRVAFEIEATAKSRDRYRQAAYAYLLMTKVDRIVYVCNALSIERIVAASFSGELFRSRNKAPFIVQLRDLHRFGLKATARLNDDQIRLQDALTIALPAIDSASA